MGIQSAECGKWEILARNPRQRVSVRPENPGPHHFLIFVTNNPQVKVRAPRDQRELPRTNHPQAKHRDERIRAALRDGGSFCEPEMRGCFASQPVADCIAGRDDSFRPLVNKIAQLEFFKQRNRRLAVHEVPPHRDVVPTSHVLPGELQVQEILVLANHRRALPQKRFPLFHPKRFGDHPLRGNRAGAAATHAKRGVAGSENLR